MSKILHFPAEATQEEWLRGVVEAINGGKRVAVIIEQDDGCVLTAYWQCDAAQKQVLLGHIQVDIIDDCVRATYGLERE